MLKYLLKLATAIFVLTLGSSESKADSCYYDSSSGQFICPSTYAISEGDVATSLSGASGRAIMRMVSGSISTRIGTFLGKLVDSRSRRAGVESFMTNAQNYQEGDETGLAAGDQRRKSIASLINVGMWTDVSGATLGTGPNTRSEETNGTSYVTIAGYDARFDKILVGLAGSASYASINLRTEDGMSQSIGVSVTPYFAYVIDENWTASTQLTYGRSYTDQQLHRSSRKTTGQFAANRFVMANDLNYFYPVDEWSLMATIGSRLAREAPESYTNSRLGTVNPKPTTFGQIVVGTEVGYRLEEDIEPYVGASFGYDWRQSTYSDRKEVILRGGLRYMFKARTTAGLEMSTMQFRHDEDSYTLVANLRYVF